LPRHLYAMPVLLQMAVDVENSARAFYKTLSRKFPEHMSLFDQLAGDEKDHAETFTHLLGQRKVREVHSTEEERRLADYNIKVLEDTGVVGNLRKGAERARKIEDLKSAVEASVQLEKDTALFYYNLAMGLGGTERQEVYKIIRVENTHLYKVQNLSI
jgi:rubrerythrin